MLIFRAKSVLVQISMFFATLAGDGSDDGGGEGETVAGGNTEEKAKTGWIKLDKVG